MALNPEGSSAPLAFDIAPGTTSFQIQITGDPASSYIVAELTDPNGRKLVSDRPEGVAVDGPRLLGQLLSPNRSALSDRPGFGSLLFPANPALAVAPGTWSMRIEEIRLDGSPVTRAPLAVQLLTKSGSGSARAKLKLHLHFSGAWAWTRDSYEANPVFAATMSAVRRMYASAGIDLEIASASDLPESLAVLSGREGIRPLLDQAVNEDGVNLFFLRDQTLMNDADGLSFGVPGPAFSGGRARSGVVIPLNRSWSDDMAPMIAAPLIAHEVGHYLGLFHTSDFRTGDPIEDPLADTEALTPMNVMFPGRPAIGAAFSPMQGQVLRAHPLARGN